MHQRRTIACMCLCRVMHAMDGLGPSVLCALPLPGRQFSGLLLIAVPKQQFVLFLGMEVPFMIPKIIDFWFVFLFSFMQYQHQACFICRCHMHGGKIPSGAAAKGRAVGKATPTRQTFPVAGFQQKAEGTPALMTMMG